MQHAKTIISHKPRILALSVMMGALGVLIAARLFYIQIVHGKEFQDNADAQYVAPKNALNDRGTIYFKKKNGELISAASQVSGYKVSVVPDTIVDPEKTFTALSNFITVDKDIFLEKAGKKGDPYEALDVHVDKVTMQEIDKLELPGIKFEQDKWRVYPGDTLSSHSIGFVAYKGNDQVGRYGLERYYENVLKRHEGGEYVNFFAEIFTNIKDSVFENTESEGDIITTIEPTVEGELEKTLADTAKKWGAEFAAGIIMNPQTGEIYAIGKSPSFDLNSFGDVEDPREYSNPFVENVFEFGSVMKPLVMAGALDIGVVTPQTTYFDKGSVVVRDRTLNNFDHKGRGTASMQDVLDQSLNTGMVFVEQKMGKDNFKKYILDYKLGERTGIDLPNETQGLLSNVLTGGDVEYATAAFGQGIAVTPIEAVRAFSALANKGEMVEPHLVTQILHTDGEVEDVLPAAPLRVIKPETAATITTMLTHVVDVAMGNGVHKMDHFSIAAKTGTAQIARDSGGGYSENKFLHSFFGYFPAENPKFLVFLFLRDPKGVDFASQTLVDPFFSIAKFLLNYYNISPDR